MKIKKDENKKEEKKIESKRKKKMNQNIEKKRWKERDWHTHCILWSI